MEGKEHPNIEEMCRLCLSILSEANRVQIFPKAATSKSNDSVGCGGSTLMSIPMRIMACAALEVQTGDGLPKLICHECRYQLEKSYYFRKRSQLSDNKLRKHIRLLNLGKRSRVFERNEDDDEFEDELEFEDSIKFIKMREEEKQAEEIAHCEQKLQDEVEQKLSLAKSEWVAEYEEKVKDEVTNKLRNTVFAQVKEELRAEMEQEIRTLLRKECMEEAKAEVRKEVKEECHETERLALLSDLELFLAEKRKRTGGTTGHEVRQPIEAEDYNTTSNKPPKRIASKRLRGTAPQATAVATPLSPPITSPTHETLDDNVELCAEERQEVEEVNTVDDVAAEEESEFYLLESVNRQEEENVVVSKKRQKIDPSQRFEYFEDTMATANFRLTASESSSQEPGEEQSYHNTGEVQYYKKMSTSNDEEVTQIMDRDNNGERIDDSNFIVFNLADESEGEQVESLNMPVMKKVYKIKDKELTNTNTVVKEWFTKNKAKGGSIITKTPNDPNYQIEARKTDTAKTFKCDFCPMVFSTKNSMNRHMRTHSGGGGGGITHQCKVCHVHLSCKSALKRHAIIHTGEKPHTCEHCGKSFVQREVLKRHTLIHTGNKPFKCGQCLRSFTSKYYLDDHMKRTHSEVPVGRKFACHLCPKRFNHMSGLSRHLVTHTGLTYQCIICKRQFSDRSSMKRHIVHVHGLGEERRESLEEAGEPAKIEFYTVSDNCNGNMEEEGEQQEQVDGNGSDFLV